MNYQHDQVKTDAVWLFLKSSNQHFSIIKENLFEWAFRGRQCPSYKEIIQSSGFSFQTPDGYSLCDEDINHRELDNYILEIYNSRLGDVEKALSRYNAMRLYIAISHLRIQRAYNLYGSDSTIERIRSLWQLRKAKGWTSNGS